jgi:deazaflavin-dependent oxidoreductase (nitroreductase family)
MTDEAYQATRTPAAPRPGPLLRWFLRVPPFLYRLGLAGLLGPRLLLLTTTGRRTGRRRTCGLNYARDGSTVYVVSGYGMTGWYRNLLADPRVEVRIGRDRWVGLARPVTGRDERRHALRSLATTGSHQGPPRWLRGLVRRIGLDYDAEVRRLEDPELDLPTIAIALTPSP